LGLGPKQSPAPGRGQRRASSFTSWVEEGRLRDLDRCRSAFAGADTDNVIDRADEHLAVADLAALRRLADGFNGGVRRRIVNHDLDLHLRQKIDGVLGPTVQFRVALLPTEPFDLIHGQALDPDVMQGIFDIAQFVWADDGTTLPRQAMRNGYRAACWHSGNLAFCAVADMAEKELDTLTQLLKSPPKS